VITDVIMPLMGGKVMAEWLKTAFPDIQILFTSGYTDDSISRHGVLDEGVDFISKPYTLATLVRKVRRMLDEIADGASSPQTASRQPEILPWGEDPIAAGVLKVIG
jgi:FixJ family two-component response regulator